MSWVISVVGIGALWLIARKVRWGWVVGLAGDGLWAWYAIDAHQLGFLLAAVVYAVVHVRGWIRWR